MRIQQVFDNIFRVIIPLPGSPLKSLNSYLIKGKNRNLLIDTGFPSNICYEAMVEGLEELQIRMQDTDIFLTHLHYDHIGLAPGLASEQTEIFIGALDKDYLENVLSASDRTTAKKIIYGAGFSLDEITELAESEFGKPYHKPVEFLGVKPGHRFHLGNYDLKCIHTPGHTPGHMCLYEESCQLLFCGDHILFDISPNITSWSGYTDSLGDYLKSLREIEQLDIRHALCGHREPMRDVKQRISQLLDHHQNRLTTIGNIIESMGTMTAYEVASRIEWAVAVPGWKNVPITQKYFAVGETIAHLEHLIANGMLKAVMIDGVKHYVTNDHFSS